MDWRPTASLIPYVRNARTHSDAQVAQIAASIKEFGWTNPVLVDGENGVIAGHGRLLAAQKLGLKDVPCIELGHLTPAQRRAYVIADNKLAEKAGWDEELLRLELGDLRDAGFDLGLTGFDDGELADIFAERTKGLTEEDDVPEPPKDPVSRPGDVWLCGVHRVRCGDSTAAAEVDALFAGVAPTLMVTDPPYGVKYDAAWRVREGISSSKALGAVRNDDRADWREAWALFPGDVAYVWHGGLHAAVVAESLLANGLEIRAQIIWQKPSLVISRGHYHWQHEPCWYAVRKGRTGHWAGDRKQSTIWPIDLVTSKRSGLDDDRTEHSTQKPVECMRRPIVNNSSPGQAVYDPFLGSGTTLIAAETTGRVCFGMELEPAYVDIIVTRWQNFTGKKAKLEGDGRGFDELAANRGA